MGKFKKAKFKTSIKVGGRKKSFVIPLSTPRSDNSALSRPCNSSACDEVLPAFDEPTTSTARTDSTGLTLHQRRIVQLQDNWSGIRAQLQSAFILASFLPSGTVCTVCGLNQASTRCESCGPQQYMCKKCAYELHSDRNQFHLLEEWKDGMFLPLYPDHGVVGYGHKCSTQLKKLFTLIDYKGVKHVKYVYVCDCEPHAVTLLKCNFWPGSPKKPTVAFHMHLMGLMEKLFLQSQVSVHDFAEVLEELQPQLGLKIFSSMYSVLNSGCFEEFRIFKYDMFYMDSYCENLSKGTFCPLCPEDEGVLIESMDACMGLVRKKCKGSVDLQEPRSNNLFFSDQVDVDNFVNNYGKESIKSNEECSRFHAGEVLSSLRSKGRNKVFDEKGVFGRVCRHDFPKSFINLKHGERISYSVYELEKLKSVTNINEPHNLKVILMYDIACILSSHLKNTAQEDLLSNTSLAIPIFHCYGHKASCQVELNPRRIKGVGLTDGEGVERLWAYLRGYAAMTKEMGAGKRIDVLTHALIFYGQRLRKRLGPSLKAKLKKAQDLVTVVGKEIEELESSLPAPVDKDTICKWKSSELNSIKPTENDLKLNWDESYVNVLLEVKQIKGQLAFCSEIDDKKVQEAQTKLKRKEKTLTLTEKKEKLKRRWRETDTEFQNSQKRLLAKQKSSLVLKLHRLASERTFLIEMKKKYADGQGIAIKLSSQISKATDAMHKSLSQLNATDDQELKFDEVKDPNSTLYCNCKPVAEANDEIPLSTKKQLIRLFCLQERCMEEISLVKVEMIRILTHNFSQQQIIENYVETLGETSHEKGLKALFLKKRICIQLEQLKLSKSFEGLLVSPYVFNNITSYYNLDGTAESSLITYENDIYEGTQEEDVKEEDEMEEEEDYQDNWNSDDSDEDIM